MISPSCIIQPHSRRQQAVVFNWASSIIHAPEMPPVLISRCQPCQGTPPGAWWWCQCPLCLADLLQGREVRGQWGGSWCCCNALHPAPPFSCTHCPPKRVGKDRRCARGMGGQQDLIWAWFWGAWDPHCLTGASLRTGNSFSHCSEPKSIRNSCHFQIHTDFPSEINTCSLTSSF